MLYTRIKSAKCSKFFIINVVYYAMRFANVSLDGASRFAYQSNVAPYDTLYRAITASDTLRFLRERGHLDYGSLI